MALQERYYPTEGSSARAAELLDKKPDLRIVKGRKAVAENFLNGFDSQIETEALRRNFNTAAGDRRLIVLDDLQPVIRENLANMASHPKEYAESNPVVLNPVALNEQDQLINSDSGYVLENMVTEDERKGSIKDSIKTSQQELAEAKPGKVLVGISPLGRTNKFENGQELIYEETQVYVTKKGQGRFLEGISFICDLTYEQCLELYGRYKKPHYVISNMSLPEIDRVSEMVSKPILINDEETNFKKILDDIEDIMGGTVMRKANGKNRTFDEARELLRNPNQLKELPKECNEVLDKYQEYLEEHISNINDDKVFDDIKLRMEIAMLEITRIINGIDETKLTGKVLPVNTVYRQAFDKSYKDKIDYKSVKNSYADEIKYLMTRPGCAGKLSSSLTGQTLGDILSGSSNILPFPGSGGFGGSTESGGTCKVCKTQAAAERGCGYCDDCASKAA